MRPCSGFLNKRIEAMVGPGMVRFISCKCRLFCAMENILTVHKWKLIPDELMVRMHKMSGQMTAETRCPIPNARGRSARYDYK